MNTTLFPSGSLGCGCSLCSLGKPPCLCVPRPSWTSIVRVILFVLHRLHPERQYFSLKTFVYPYARAHWTLLVLDDKNTKKWKKQILDALSHNSRLFATGQYSFLKSGYWGLKYQEDPWEMARTMVLDKCNRQTFGADPPPDPASSQVYPQNNTFPYADLVRFPLSNKDVMFQHELNGCMRGAHSLRNLFVSSVPCLEDRYEHGACRLPPVCELVDAVSPRPRIPNIVLV